MTAHACKTLQKQRLQEEEKAQGKAKDLLPNSDEPERAKKVKETEEAEEGLGGQAWLGFGAAATRW